jgi:DUF971 family protein
VDRATTGDPARRTLSGMVEPERIEIPEGREMIITWADGRVDHLPANVLRDACACAECRNLPGPRPPADPEQTRIASAGLVGAYAINIVFFPDRHGTGIYPYSGLRTLAETGEMPPGTTG